MRGGPKVRCGGRWTESAFTSFIKNALRAASSRWAPKYDCLKAARVARGKYKCAACGELFGPKEVKVDHIEPVVDPVTGFLDWNEYIKRLFVEITGYQTLCVGCHHEKSIAENERRRTLKSATII